MYLQVASEEDCRAMMIFERAQQRQLSTMAHADLMKVVQYKEAQKETYAGNARQGDGLMQY